MNFAELAKQAPRFVERLLGLLGGPRRYLGSLDLAAPAVLTEAMVFYTLALIVDAILALPFGGDATSFWTGAAIGVVVQVLSLFVMVMILTLIWRLLGGRAALRSHLIYSLYLWGVGVLILGLSGLAAKGLVMVRRPDWFETYRDYMTMLMIQSPEIEAERFVELDASDLLFMAMLVLLVGHLLLIAWFLAGWGAFRDLNESTRGRAILALILFLVVAYPINYLLVAGQYAAGVAVF